MTETKTKIYPVINNTTHPDPDPPAAAAAVPPLTHTRAVGRWQNKDEKDSGGSWPVVLGVKAPPEDDYWSYKDYRKGLVWQALNRIAEKRGISVMVGDFKKAKTYALGLCVSELSVILINELVPNWYKSKVLAHELAHYKLHGNLDMAAYENDRKYFTTIEKEAEHFADRLLRFVKCRLPKPQLPPGYKSINTLEGWNELARRREEEAKAKAA